jgi:hypothetical protein
MESHLVTAPHLLPALAALERLEPLYHAAFPDATPADFERLVAPDFWEVGATGRRYSRAFALRVLSDRHGRPDPATWHTDRFHLQEAGPGLFLLSYRLRQPSRVTLRLTVWRREGDGWLALYHQGTVVSV